MSDSNDSADEIEQRKRDIFAKIAGARLPSGELDFVELEKTGILTSEEIEFLSAYLLNEVNAEEPSSDPHERLGQLLMKIRFYQQGLPEDRAIELGELIREKVLSTADVEFMDERSVTYKPHRIADYHAMDMFHMPEPDGGCVFMGPGGPPLKKRTYAVEAFQKVMEDFLRIPNPDLLMHVEFTEEEGPGFGLAPKLLMFQFKSPAWRERIDVVRKVAAEFGLSPRDDRELQESWNLSFEVSDDPKVAASIAYALLTRGCGVTGEITYSAGALDVLENA
jgi:hypothetical protein